MLSIQEHRSFPLSNVLQILFMVSKVLTVETIINGIFFLISFSAILLPFYTKVTEFGILILYPANYCTCFSRLKLFWLESMVSFKYRLMPSANKEKFNFSFPTLIPFVTFSYYCREDLKYYNE